MQQKFIFLIKFDNTNKNFNINQNFTYRTQSNLWWKIGGKIKKKWEKYKKR